MDKFLYAIHPSRTLDQITKVIIDLAIHQDLAKCIFNYFHLDIPKFSTMPDSFQDKLKDAFDRYPIFDDALLKLGWLPPLEKLKFELAKHRALDYSELTKDTNFFLKENNLDPAYLESSKSDLIGRTGRAYNSYSGDGYRSFVVVWIHPCKNILGVIYPNFNNQLDVKEDILSELNGDNSIDPLYGDVTQKDGDQVRKYHTVYFISLTSKRPDELEYHIWLPRSNTNIEDNKNNGEEGFTIHDLHSFNTSDRFYRPCNLTYSEVLEIHRLY
jgi:hypothetical protein